MSNTLGPDQSVLLIPNISDILEEHKSNGNSAAMLSSTFGQYPFSPSSVRKQDEMEIFKSKSRNTQSLSLVSDRSEFYTNGEKAPKVFNSTTYEVENPGILNRLSPPSKKCTLLIFILAITLILAIIFLTSRFKIEIKETFSEEISVPQLSPNLRPTPKISLMSLMSNRDSFQINSAQDVQTIVNATTVTVNYLIDDPIDIPASSYFEPIKNLEIAGPVSEEWLIRLLNLFPNIQTLTLDIDQLCVGSKVKNRNALKPLKLEKIQVLKILNSNMCLLANWVYQWDLPALTKFSIRNSDISKLNSQQMNDFVRQNSKMLTDVYILNCFVCNDCTLPEESDGFQLNIEKAVSGFDYSD
ncbi:unnamed protein product [Allacma fusca]|uniref:Uncharacterized protein n=1 Tax=Allacma fusca TaxID=39272 RepID=A0A8J2JSB3_9HEXA|nr:unnamed protein product [Allacma fusca]